MAESTSKTSDSGKASEVKSDPGAKSGTSPSGATTSGRVETKPKGTSTEQGETADDTPRDGVAAELDRLGVDPRLDNRVGRQRPQTPEDVLPQQVHGGYAGDDSEFEDPPSGKPTDPHRSEGPHGRGPQSGPSSED